MATDKNGDRKRFYREQEKPALGTLLDRQPPYSQDAEIGVLGSMMLMPVNIDDLATEISSEDFYFEANQLLFQTFIYSLK